MAGVPCARGGWQTEGKAGVVQVGEGDLAGAVSGSTPVLWLLAHGETSTVMWKEKEREEMRAGSSDGEMWGTWGSPLSSPR